MVASESAHATRAGVELLEAGGNAVDAIVATTFALAVTFPEAGNLGGGGFAVLRLPGGERAALDFRETAPAAATRDMYLDGKGNPTEESVEGHRASGVPGSVAGLYALHERYGKRPWREVVTPAIRLARDGFKLEANTARALASAKARQRIARWPGSAALWMPHGKPLEAGTFVKNPDLAAALERIAEKGPAGFYTGETAALIVAEMKRGNGLITEADLAGYQPKWREPIVVEYRGHQVIAMPPPSSGGIVIAMILRLLEDYDLRAIGWHTPEHLSLLAEASRRAFVDRNEYLADPDFVDWPKKLLSDEYLAARRATIVKGKATPSSEVKPGLGESDDTTHLAAVDEAGLAVSLTTTINGLFGSAVTVTGAGFFLNNEMDDFTVKPGVPNMFKLVQGKANAIAPKKRMLSAMSPSIVVGPNKQVLLLAGGRGGSRIISATLQVISNVVDFGMDVEQAVAAPRIHMQHLPDQIFHEPDGLTPATQKALEAMGYKLAIETPIAGSPAIMRRGKLWRGMIDPRKGGLAAGPYSKSGNGRAGGAGK
jgi:gamma-glutamyltranspeptidase/glutathione hydrolase